MFGSWIRSTIDLVIDAVSVDFCIESDYRREIVTWFEVSSDPDLPPFMYPKTKLVYFFPISHKKCSLRPWKQLACYMAALL